MQRDYISQGGVCKGEGSEEARQGRRHVVRRCVVSAAGPLHFLPYTALKRSCGQETMG